MSDTNDKRDQQWSVLLTRCYESVEAKPEFKSSLLADMKKKQAEMRDEAAKDVGADEQWSTLLGKTYPVCEARKGFKKQLLVDLKQKIAPEQPVVEEFDEDAPLRTLLSNSYTPVEPRREFQTRLLDNLKERQKTTIMIKEQYRKRSIFTSLASGLAAAAAVLFVVWLGPLSTADTEAVLSDRPQIPADAQIASSTPVSATVRHRIDTSSIQTVAATDAASPIPNAVFPYAYNMNAAFDSSSLPKTVRGVGMELNDGNGWRPMDESLLTRLSAGMVFRATRETAGLGFSDGSTVLMWPESTITATDNGFAVDQGQLAVTVPAGGEQRFRLQLAERDIVVEPGTMMAVNAYFPDRYAAGGAPAPEVKILDGGMAVARGRNGDAPLLANQVYLIDNYITPDIPGRPMCGAEFAELSDCYNATPGLPGFSPQDSYSPTQLVSGAPEAAQPNSAPRGYTKQGMKWVADSYKDQPVTRVKYLSSEYFALANARRDLASALSAGPEAIIDGGKDGFYEIHR